MPQAWGSATTQSVGNPGFLILTCFESATGNSVSVSFNPTLCKMVQPQFGPLQKVNVAVGGQFHIFQLSDNEPLVFPVEFMDLPWNSSDQNPEPTQGYADLLSFVRYTLNYWASTCQITTPDGMVETVRYNGGIDTFREAEGRSQRAQRWTGNIQFVRVLS